MPILELLALLAISFNYEKPRLLNKIFLGNLNRKIYKVNGLIKSADRNNIYQGEYCYDDAYWLNRNKHHFLFLNCFHGKKVIFLSRLRYLGVALTQTYTQNKHT